MTLYIKDASQKQYLARHVNLGTRKNHTPIMMQMQRMILLDHIIFVEIPNNQKNQYGVILLTHKLHLNYVSL